MTACFWILVVLGVIGLSDKDTCHGFFAGLCVIWAASYLKG